MSNTFYAQDKACKGKFPVPSIALIEEVPSDTFGVRFAFQVSLCVFYMHTIISLFGLISCVCCEGVHRIAVYF